MNPLQVEMFLNEINGNDDEEIVEDRIEQFMIKVNDGGSKIQTVERWTPENFDAPDSWKKFQTLWETDHYDWIKKGNGIILMWSKDTDNVYPYVWWYIGFNKNRGLFESASWLLSGEFYDDELGVIKIETCNWNGFNLSDLTEQVAAKMLEFTSDWDGALPDEIGLEWANCATGLNLWKTSFTMEQLMSKTLNWSNANLEILLG